MSGLDITAIFINSEVDVQIALVRSVKTTDQFVRKPSNDHSPQNAVSIAR